MSNPNPPQLGWELTDPISALASFLGSLSQTPQLLGLGEPTHQIEDFLVWRNRVFRTLVESHGYRSIALESDSLAGLKVDTYVTSGRGPLEETMRCGFSHGFGEARANRDLITWMRRFNEGRDEADHVRFYGFDAPLETMWARSPRHALSELHAFLDRHLTGLPTDGPTLMHQCGEDAPWTNEAAAMNPTQSIGASEKAKTLRWLADDLRTLLVTERPRLEAHADFWHAQLHARTAQGLLRYHAVMADHAPNRIVRLLTLRDRMMADNLSAITQREAPRGPTLAFAHNQHLQRHNGRWTFSNLDEAWVPAGVHMTSRLQGRYAFVATAVGEGAGLPTPPPHTLETWFTRRSSLPSLYATSALTGVLPPALVKRTDTSGKNGYVPMALDPGHLQHMDGVLFLPTLARENKDQRAGAK